MVSNDFTNIKSTNSKQKKQLVKNEIKNSLNMKLSNEQQKTVESNIKLVGYIAKKFKDNSVEYFEYNELFQVGTIGLIKAVLNFDNSKNTKFSTYAYKCIKNELLLYLNKENKHKNISSLDKPITSDKKTDKKLTLYETIDSKINYEDLALDNIHIQKIRNIIQYKLDEKEKTIIQLYFYENMSQENIAQIINTSRAYVTKKVKKIIKNISIELENESTPRPTTMSKKLKQK